MAELARHRLWATEQAPRTARALLAELGESVTLEQAQVAQLLVSEVVTNALRHTPSEVIWIEVETGERVRVSVTDNSPHLPEHHSPHPDEIDGRGILLVQELADHWGSEIVPGHGKRVWFELSRPPGASQRYSVTDPSGSG